mmetsp:Transcript_8925/g.15776  ORF Transcript_8925/g.15776 Transcript_8925/m.15776 type:complete len:866 (-) Transcript_8925:73-2670(-)
MKSTRQKSLKPLLEIGTAVYSAYWCPLNDPSRDLDPDWYPGVVSSYKVSKTIEDERYGNVRYYNVHFDDGDESEHVADHFIMGAEEYLLNLRQEEGDEDEMGSRHLGRGSGKRHSLCWMGVKNVTDRTSCDMWARHVGWYVATIDDVEHTFSLLSDALRAYDAAIVRSNGGSSTNASSLNLPEDWSRLFEHQKSNSKTAIKEGIKEGITKAQKWHTAELDHLKHHLQRKHDDAKDLAVTEATAKERRHVREMQHKLKKELKAQHDKEHKKLKKQSQEEMEQLKLEFQDEKERLQEEQKEAAEQAREIIDNCLAAEKAAHEARTISKRQRNRGRKPFLEVGEEVCAAWWPDTKRRDTASWYAGRVKSYREVESNNEGGEDEYGPVRLYKIKYDEDGDELDGIPEHFVFPKADYLLSTENHASSHKWKGVQNVVDVKSNDQYAKLVGWYTATIDDREEDFARLADALQAYDASIVRRKGDKTRRNELNLPKDWEWLFGKNGIREPELYDVEEFQQELLEEKKKWTLKLEKKHEQEKGIAVREAVKEAVENERHERKAMQTKLRKDLKVYYEKEKSRVVKEASEEAQLMVEEATKKAQQEHSQHVEEATKKAQQEHSQHMEKLRGELQQQFHHEKEKALYWLRMEMKQQQLELTRLKAELETNNMEQEKKKLRRESFSNVELSPPPAKRVKVSHGHGSGQGVVGSVTPPKPSSGSIGKKNLPDQLLPPPFTDIANDTCSSKQHTYNLSPKDKQHSYNLSPKDQSAGENTTEGKGHRHGHASVTTLPDAEREQKQDENAYHQHAHQRAIAALLVAAERMESEKEEEHNSSTDDNDDDDDDDGQQQKQHVKQLEGCIFQFFGQQERLHGH